MSDRRNHERGQMLILFAVALVVMLVLTGVVLDGGLMMVSWWSLQEDADAACIAGATGGDANAALGAAGQPAATVTSDGRTLRLEVTKTEPVYFLHLVGFDSLMFDVRSRCLIPQASLVPIAVKEPWLIDGLLDPDEDYPILGNEGKEGDQCDTCKGSDFAGAVIPNIVCENRDCDPRFFYGVDEKKSPNTYKDVIQDLLSGDIRTILSALGTRVPQIAGVSNKFLVQTIEENYSVGDHLIVLIFDGEITDNSPWENLKVISYAEVEITKIETNVLWVRFIQQIDSSEGVNLLTRTRTVHWNWAGG